MKEIVPDSTIMQQKQLVELTVDSLKDNVFPVTEDSSIKKKHPTAQYC